MAKRTIGIDLSSSHFYAVQVSRTAGRLHLEKTFSSPLRRSTDSPDQLLSSLTTEHGFDRRAPVALAADSADLFFRNILSDSSDKKSGKLDSLPPVKDHFPLDPNDTIIDLWPHPQEIKHRTATLVTATGRKSARTRLNALKRTHLRCELMDAPVFALHTAVVTNHPQDTAAPFLMLYSDGLHLILALADRKDVYTVRNLPCFSTAADDAADTLEKFTALITREIELSWRSIMAKTMPTDTVLFLAGSLFQDPDLLSHLQDSLTSHLIPLNLTSQLTSTLATATISPDLGIAQGLALRALSPRDSVGVNFIKADNQKEIKSAGLKKQFLILVALLTLLGAISVISLFVRRSRLEHEYLGLKNEIRTVFRQTLPAETTIVDEMAQMDTALHSLRREYANLAPLSDNAWDPLTVLHTLFTHTPSQLKVSINSISISGSLINLSAQCDSFTVLEQWRSHLQKVPAFASVEINNPQKIPDSHLVAFNAQLTLYTEKP